MYKLLGIIFAGTVLLLSEVIASPKFKKSIPNAANIPDPCDRTKNWDAIGHQAASGGGALTPFGSDFAAAGNKYTKELCMMDSDGDGKSNGVELGDPNCVWAVNATPAITERAQLSHPGVCEPLNAPQCAGKNVFLNSACLAASSEMTSLSPISSSNNASTTLKTNNNATTTAVPSIPSSTVATNSNTSTTMTSIAVSSTDSSVSNSDADDSAAKGSASAIHYAKVSLALTIVSALLSAVVPF